MPIKIEFPKTDQQSAGNEEQDVAKIQQAISFIESGDTDQAIAILKTLLAGEQQEASEEAQEGEGQPMPGKGY